MNAKQTVELSHDDGRQLATDLLREIRALSSGESCFMEGGCRMPQENLVMRYVSALRGPRNHMALEAFCAVLTDFVASGYGGGVPDPETYERAHGGIQ